MDQLTELFKQMQELAGVGLDMLHGAQGAQHGNAGQGGAPHPGGAPGQAPGGSPAPESEKQEGPPQPPGR